MHFSLEVLCCDSLSLITLLSQLNLALDLPFLSLHFSLLLQVQAIEQLLVFELLPNTCSVFGLHGWTTRRHNEILLLKSLCLLLRFSFLDLLR